MFLISKLLLLFFFFLISSPLVLSVSIQIQGLLFSPNESGINIEFLWVPSHVGISSNQVTDFFTTNIQLFTILAQYKIPFFDFTSALKVYTCRLWDRKWKDLPITFASFYRSLYSSILPCTWFHRLNITRTIIMTFSRLRFGHNRLPVQAFYLYLNDSQSCTRHCFETKGDAGHILFYYPVLDTIWQILSNIF